MAESLTAEDVRVYHKMLKGAIKFLLFCRNFPNLKTLMAQGVRVYPNAKTLVPQGFRDARSKSLKPAP